jgi:hypothetical protein
VKGAVCLISIKSGEVRLEFIHGVRLADRARLLRGTGVSKRYAPIASASQAEVREIAELIRDASAVEFAASDKPLHPAAPRGSRRRQGTRRRG